MKESERGMNRQTLIRLMFLFYIIGIISITLIVRETMILRVPENRCVVLEPFREFNAFLHTPDHLYWFMQIFLNIFLFVPFGFLLPCTHMRFRNWMTTVSLGWLMSGLIEMMQYITGRGVMEVDDVIHNTLGALCGFVLYEIIFLRIRNRRKWYPNGCRT